MGNTSGKPDELNISRERMIELLNEDLAREYQAIIAYVVYSKLLKGAAYSDIAGELEKHASEELDHALKITQQIDYLGRHADHDAQTGQDVRQSGGHAALRFGKRTANSR